LITRPLSVIERAIAQVDRAAPLNFTAYARVRGPLDERVGRIALNEIQKRHPLLRAHLEGDYLVEGAPELPLRVAGDLIDAVNHEIATPFVDGSALVRAVLVPDGVLFTFHHVIGDGRSGSVLARDFVRSAAAALRGEDPSLPVLPPMPPTDARLPPLRVIGVLRIAYFILLELYQRVRYGGVLQVPRVRHMPVWERPAKVIAKWFSPDETAAITERARGEGVTVHAVLSAAILLAVAELSGSARRRVAFGTPLDIRKSVRPIADEEVGFLASMIGYRGLVDPKDDLFDLARRIKGELDTDKKYRGAVVGLRLLSLVAQLLGDDGGDPRAMAERFQHAVKTTTGLTNLGRLAIESAHPPLTIEAFAFTANPSVLGDFVCSAATLEGTMSLWFAHASPMIETSVAEAIADDTVTRILRATAR